MTYRKTCGSKSCANQISSNVKQGFTEEQKQIRTERYRQSMSLKTKKQIEEISTKRKSTYVLKYGVDHPWKSSQVREKIQLTMEKKYGHRNFSSTLIPPESKILLENREWLYTKHVLEQTPLYVIAKQLNVGDRTVGVYLHNHNIKTHNFQSAQWEKELEDFLKEHNVQFQRNARDIIPPKELDFYIPKFNLAIELCGLYWHSDAKERITKHYHEHKYKECQQQNIRLLTIFEDEWERKHVIFSKIKHLIRATTSKCYARNLQVVSDISKTERNNFFEKTHIQGDGKGSICIGLRNANQVLVALGLFSKQSNQKDTYVLERYSTCEHVVGGFSKIISAFEKLTNCKKIITFADKRWSNGELYLKTNFYKDKDLPIDYAYVVNNKRIHKFNFRHKHLKKRLNNYDPSLSESQNCNLHGIYRIWDCGKIRFVRERKL
jgi:hypothetical protein